MMMNKMTGGLCTIDENELRICSFWGQSSQVKYMYTCKNKIYDAVGITVSVSKNGVSFLSLLGNF